MFNRIKWSSARWNLCSRKSPPLSWGGSLPKVWVEGTEGAAGLCSIKPITGPQPARHCFLSLQKMHHPVSESYHILLRFLKSQPSNSNKVLHRLPLRKLTWKRNCWEKNSASKENRVSHILFTDHRPCLWEERLHRNLDFELTRQESPARQELLSLLLGILMILQDRCLKARGKIHSLVLKSWS